MPSRTYLELSEGGSSKFYEVIIDGCDVAIRYGRIGAKGRAQSKTLGSSAAATAFAAKKINEKKRKGYGEVAGASATPSGTPAPAAPAPATPTPRPTPISAPVVWRFASGSQAFGLFVDAEHCWVGNEGGRVFCLDHAGKVVQQFQLPEGVKTIVADESWRYAGCDDGKIYDISGKVPYVAYEVSKQKNNDIYWIDIFDGVLGVSDAKGSVTVINHEEESQWSAQSPGKFGWMVRCDEIGVYHGYKSGLSMYDWEDGSKLWEHPLGGAVLFGWQDEANVYAAASDKKIYRYSKSGEFGQAFVCDGMVFACSASDDGRLIFASDNAANVYCFEQNGARRWKLKTGCGSAYSMQYLNGRLFIVTTRGTLACLDVTEETLGRAGQGQVELPREIEAPAQADAEARVDHVEQVAASSTDGILVHCLKDGGKLRVKVLGDGYEKDWNVQFPRGLRVAGARFFVDDLVEAKRGGFYRVKGEIRRLED